MLRLECFELRNAFERTSPILTIQKTIKMHLGRRLYQRKKRYVKLLYWALNR